MKKKEKSEQATHLLVIFFLSLATPPLPLPPPSPSNFPRLLKLRNSPLSPTPSFFLLFLAHQSKNGVRAHPAAVLYLHITLLPCLLLPFSLYSPAHCCCCCCCFTVLVLVLVLVSRLHLLPFSIPGSRLCHLRGHQK